MYIRCEQFPQQYVLWISRKIASWHSCCCHLLSYNVINAIVLISTNYAKYSVKLTRMEISNRKEEKRHFLSIINIISFYIKFYSFLRIIIIFNSQENCTSNKNVENYFSFYEWYYFFINYTLHCIYITRI